MPATHTLTIRGTQDSQTIGYYLAVDGDISPGDSTELGSSDFIQSEGGLSKLHGRTAGTYSDSWKFTGAVIDFGITMGHVDIELDGSLVTEDEVRAVGTRQADAATLNDEIQALASRYDNLALEKAATVDDLATATPDRFAAIFTL